MGLSMKEIEFKRKFRTGLYANNELIGLFPDSEKAENYASLLGEDHNFRHFIRNIDKGILYTWKIIPKWDCYKFSKFDPIFNQENFVIGYVLKNEFCSNPDYLTKGKEEWEK